MKKKKLIAYEGECFTIEWYYNDQGNSNALEYYEKLPVDRKKKLAYLLIVLGDVGAIRNKEKFRYEGDQIYALKAMPDRFLCFFYDGEKIIITNAYEKKMAKMPAKEKVKAVRAKKDYIKRCKQEDYYD